MTHTTTHTTITHIKNDTYNDAHDDNAHNDDTYNDAHNDDTYNDTHNDSHSTFLPQGILILVASSDTDTNLVL